MHSGGERLNGLLDVLVAERAGERARAERGVAQADLEVEPTAEARQHVAQRRVCEGEHPVRPRHLRLYVDTPLGAQPAVRVHPTERARCENEAVGAPDGKRHRTFRDHYLRSS
jgi:hypothetical protein